MTEPWRASRPRPRPGLAAGTGLAFLVAVVFFVLAAALIPLRHNVVLIILWSAVYAGATIGAARRWGPQLGVPMAIAAGLAFDSFYIPPTRSFGESTWQNWLVISIYLGFGALVGTLAARSQHAAEASERARGQLADEQAALRRVATLVAQQQPPPRVFSAVTEELGCLLGAGDVRLVRCHPDGTVSVVAAWPSAGGGDPAELPSAAEAAVVAVRSTHASARRVGNTSHEGAAVAAPVVVEGKVWGAVVCASPSPAAFDTAAEARVGQFTELAATAISNVETQTELAASRTRIVAAGDTERRRVVRDLHDGAQQRLVHTVIVLKLARRQMTDDHPATQLVDEALDQAQQATDELRELAHGIMPAVLTRGGLRAGVEALATRMPVPVECAVDVERLPALVEATAYLVVAETLTNVAKHAAAHHASVTATSDGAVLHLQVHDDGVGGARPDGDGLVGIADRIAVLGGRLAIQSEIGRGTTIDAWLPTDTPRDVFESRQTR